MPDPKAQQASSPPLAVPRPLRTGGKFTIVLPKKRVLYRHWNKEVFLPGEEAELIVETDGTDGDKYELVLEKAPAEDGPWEQVTSLEAKADGGRARARYKFPKPEPKGRLTKADWKRRRAEPGDRLGLHVEAEGCEGAFLSIHVERRDEDGSWDVYTRWQGKIEGGKYDGVFAVPPRDRKAQEAAAAQLAANQGRILELAFERSPVGGGRAWMRAKTENLDKTQLRFVLERADESGNWLEIGSAVSTIRKGAARNSVPVPPLPPPPEHDAPDARTPIRFAIVHLHSSDEVVVSVDPEWSKGRPYQVDVERRRLDEEGWQRVSTVQPPPAPEPATPPPAPVATVPPAAPTPVVAQPHPAAPPVVAQPHPAAPPPIAGPPPSPATPPQVVVTHPAPGPPPVPAVAIGGASPVARPPSPIPGAPATTPVTPIAQVPVAMPAAPPQVFATPVPAIPTPVQVMAAPVQAVPPSPQAIATPAPAVPQPPQAIASAPPSAAAPPPPPPPAAPADLAVPPPQPDLGGTAGTSFTPPETAGGPGAFPSATAGDGPSLPSLADAPSAPGNESFSDALSKARKAKERVEDTADKLAEARKKVDESAPDDVNIEE